MASFHMSRRENSLPCLSRSSALEPASWAQRRGCARTKVASTRRPAPSRNPVRLDVIIPKDTPKLQAMQTIPAALKTACATWLPTKTLAADQDDRAHPAEPELERGWRVRRAALANPHS